MTNVVVADGDMQQNHRGKSWVVNRPQLHIHVDTVNEELSKSEQNRRQSVPGGFWKENWRKIESVRSQHVGNERRVGTEGEPVRTCAGMNTDVHGRREPSWEAIFLELMNQDGHEIGEKELLAGCQGLPIEMEVSDGEKE